MNRKIPETSSELFERFFSKVSVIDDLSCWNWTSCLNKYGYGTFSINNKNYRSHRISYEIFFGKIPDNLIIRHKCDNRKCINPHHLEIGTQKENVKDMFDRKRDNISSGKIFLRPKKPRKQFCKRGHEKIGSNIYITSQGGVSCKQCIKILNDKHNSIIKNINNI